MFFSVNQILNMDLIDEDIFTSKFKAEVNSKINVPQKGCIFDPFVKLFNTSSHWCYIPSYFIPTKLEVKIANFNLLEYIIHNQYIILDYYTMDSLKYITELNNILEQYQTITNKLLK
jgi:hypothetical protein